MICLLPPPFEIGNTKIIAMHIIYSRAFKSIMELIHLGDKRKCDACQALKVPDFRIHVFVQRQILFFLRSYSSFFCRPMEIIPFPIFVRSLQRHNEPFIIIISHCALYDWVKFICYSVQMDWMQTLFFFYLSKQKPLSCIWKQYLHQQTRHLYNR